MLKRMCTPMPKSTREERLRWVLPIIRREIGLKEVALVFPHSQRTLERWISSYRKDGEAGLEPRSTRPKTNPKDTPIAIKEQVLAMRKEIGLSALKLSWKLKKQGLRLHPRTISKFIKQEGLTRKYRTRKIKYKYIKVPLAKGELVEIDIKYVPEAVEGKKYYQFTAIDCASRWRYLEVYDDFSNYTAIDFLRRLIEAVDFRIRAIKTDNGSYFTNRYVGYSKSTDPLNPKIHAFDLECQRLNIIHYLIDPGKPQQNGKVERSHRSDQESFYDHLDFGTLTLEELKLKIRLWNNYYNDLEHCGLDGKTPNEMLLLV